MQLRQPKYAVKATQVFYSVHAEHLSATQHIPVYMLASSPGHSQILSCSCGEKSGKAWDQNYITTGNGGLG